MFFIPNGYIQQHITGEVVRQILEAVDIAKQHLGEALEFILEKARNTFAILVLIKEVPRIIRFIEIDFRASTIDDRLPLSFEELRTLFPSSPSSPSVVAKEFYEKQRELTAPVFSESHLCRRLPDDTILPFVKETKIGEGAFGTVSKVEVEDSHLRLGNRRSKVRSSTTVEFVSDESRSLFVRC